MVLFTPPPDAETQWRRFQQQVQEKRESFFTGGEPIVGARAPGRLDILGGVADYSGSIVLEMPIAEAAFAAWQWRADRTLRIHSVGIEADGFNPEVSLSLDEMVDANGHIRPVEEVRERLRSDPRSAWVGYIAGCFYVMLSAYGRVSQGRADSLIGQRGANILLSSDVPPGAGVSSSAAIEVATMHALSEAAGIQPSDLTLAAWCQRVENLIVGAPCGIMDQVTSALGRQGALTVLKCQPHDLLGTQHLPPGWGFLGIDSRVRHSVGGSAYTKARVGAFMGLKIIQLESGGKLLDNYLCKMSPSEFAQYREMLPETLTGQEYHALYGRLPDTVTRVDPAETYRPRACAEHPILENDRAREFVALMHLASLREEERNERFEQPRRAVVKPDDQILREAGRLMYDAHASYSDRLDLGAPETDLLVGLIRERGPRLGLFGAKITGGGSGGTVAVLYDTTSADAERALQEVCEEYTRRTGLTPRLFLGSSPGAVMFGARPIA